MISSEIPQEQWSDFVDQFSRDHTGWPVTVEVLSGESGPQRLAQEQPLQGISFDTAGTRPSALQIGVGDRPSVNIQHTVELPLHIRLASDEAQERGTLQIEPARGPSTLLHFHRPESPGKMPTH